ncbi:MAG TPA: 3-oxoacyl-[acyl-carrier-protein] reductase [Bacteroidaceae bacterium]|jgi:3-oxoacyl-[acyl-carrier protein] reductase|nr:3-oxoacyl-[acyl-carrier-protein] reductase [Bacteroidaceae bacterium]HOD68850.1 3-oxoacyl-[acyl-carrier-protein] reductase [Bacteroidaceae bacterium]HQL26014.1 3-oxoacyl-[acyl-carrier-protein] reductase [Bacteroidaceae bacterium]
MGQLSGKTVLVTGGTRGIGYAMVQLFAAEGANIAFIYMSSVERAVALEQELAGKGIKAKGYKADVALFDDAQKTVDEVVKEFGRIDVLVNNAGITRDGLLMRMNEQQWDEVIDTNLKSAFNYTKACTPIMMRQRSGCILTVSSVVGVHGNAGQANYSASKAGLIGFTKSVAKELASRGVRANVIAPGFVMTEMTQQIPEEKLAEWCKTIPIQRGASVEEIANVALFLVSDQSSYITGQVIQVDGGMSM